MTTFSSINENILAAAISRCQNRLVYIAPSVTLAITQAIEGLLLRTNEPNITLVIDTDPEVCRLGYGTIEGLKHLQQIVTQYHLALRFQDGLRVGVLISDDEVIAYAPTPLLIEAGTTSTGLAQANAIILGAHPLNDVLSACAEDSLFTEAEIGNRAITPNMLKATLNALEEQPPKAYDIARIERVYSSKLQYVEFEVVGYRLSSRRAKIPNDLLVGDDEILEQRLQNSFSLLEGKDALIVEIDDCDPHTNEKKFIKGDVKKIKYSEMQIEKDRKKIYEDFLIAIPKHGQLISRARREAFDARIVWFKHRLAQFKNGVSESLDLEIKQSIQDLSMVLLEGVRKRPPERYLKFSYSSHLTDEQLISEIENDLRQAFDINKFFDPQINIVFKDLTYETIQNPDFRKLLNQKFQGLNQSTNDLFHEHDAAPELGHQNRPHN